MDWNYRHTLLALCTLAFFVTMMARLIVSPLVPAITTHFEITNTAIGSALTGMWFAYALVQFPSGLLGDRFGERAVVLVSIGGTAVMGIVLALAPVFLVFVISLVLVGAVAGLHYSVATTLLAKYFDGNIGAAMGIHTIGAPAAGLLAPIAAAWVGTRYGWRFGVALVTLVAVPVFIMFAYKIRKSEPHRPDEPVLERLEFQPLYDLLSKPPIAFTVVIAAAFAFVWQGVASFLPTFLIDYRGQTATLAGIVFSMYFVVQALAKPVVGSCSDRYGRDIVIMGCLTTTALGIGLFVGVSGVAAIIAATILVGIGLTWSSAVEPRFMDELSIEERNVGLGLVRTTYLLLGSSGSIAVGWFSDAFGWAVSFIVLIVVLLVIIVAVVGNSLLELGY